MSAIKKLNLSQLSKTVSHALRHEPWLYELELDNEGFVLIELLLKSLRQEKIEWSDLSESDLYKMILASDKKRHEIRRGKIRALYGHSLPGKLSKKLAIPPKTLYHGTSPSAAKLVKNCGLRPMHRQYVHLSVDIETAEQVGQRKAKRPVILTIRAYEGSQSGISFYQGNTSVWLADVVLPEFIDFPEA